MCVTLCNKIANYSNFYVIIYTAIWLINNNFSVHYNIKNVQNHTKIILLLGNI